MYSIVSDNTEQLWMRFRHRHILLSSEDQRDQCQMWHPEDLQQPWLLLDAEMSYWLSDFCVN